MNFTRKILRVTLEWIQCICGKTYKEKVAIDRKVFPLWTSTSSNNRLIFSFCRPITCIYIFFILWRFQLHICYIFAGFIILECNKPIGDFRNVFFNFIFYYAFQMFILDHSENSSVFFRWDNVKIAELHRKLYTNVLKNKLKSFLYVHYKNKLLYRKFRWKYGISGF